MARPIFFLLTVSADCDLRVFYERLASFDPYAILRLRFSLYDFLAALGLHV